MQPLLFILFRPFTVGHVFDDEHDALRRAQTIVHTARIEKHGTVADGLKIVCHLEIPELGILRQNGFEQCAQLRNIPLPMSQFIDKAALSFSRIDLKCLIKSLIGCVHAQIVFQDEAAARARYEAWPRHNRARA